MSSNNIELRVGILVILALIIFVGTIIWIQGYRFGKENYKVNVKFKEVGSLSEGDPVIVSGIRMGKVEDLWLIPDGVMVRLLISNDVVLLKGTKITVKNIGLMGERYISISPGDSDSLLDLSKPIEGGYDTGIPEVMGMMGEMISELRNLVYTLKSSVASKENLQKLSQTIGDFQKLSASMADYFESNRKNLDKTAQNFVESSKAIKELITRNEATIDSVVNRTDQVTHQLKSITNDLEYLAAAARDFADKLQEGDGTLQMLVEDRRLYDDLRKTADNLDDLIQDIRENPKKYIQLKLELF